MVETDTSEKAFQNLIKLNILKSASGRKINKLFVAPEILDVVIV